MHPNLTFVGIIYQIVGIRQEKEILGFSGDRLFEENAGITDISNYTERTTSTATGQSTPSPMSQKRSSPAILLTTTTS